jgi:dihydropteroate synthase-like protein
MHEAERFRAAGADVIDVGCTPGLPFPALADTVRELRAAGFRCSIDSLDPAEIRTAVDAGAELVLSVNGFNRGVLADLRGSGARVVVIPDGGAGLDSLDPTLDEADQAGIGVLVDPIVEPIGFGFYASLERYGEARRRYPSLPLFMGVGNITELTSADSTGVNALLIAICEELGVEAVLTTEVIPWARGAVREIDIARRLMHHAISRGSLPKGVDDRLVTVKDPVVLTYSEAELRELQRQVTDPNYRIFTDRETITVFNREQFVRGTDIQQLFDQLGVSDPSHAFYLGKELAKARLAIALGKTYRQEGQLAWGYLTPPEDPQREHFRPSPGRRSDV